MEEARRKVFDNTYSKLIEVSSLSVITFNINKLSFKVQKLS